LKIKNASLFAILAGLLFVSAFAGQSISAQPDKVLVYIKTGSPEQTSQILANPDVSKRFDLTDGWISAEVPIHVRDVLATHKDITIENVNQFQIIASNAPDEVLAKNSGNGRGNNGGTLTRQAVPSDQTPWGIETIYGDNTISSTSGGNGTRVAIIDTGISPHVDFGDMKTKVQVCLDYTAKRGIKESCSDGNGHGTHVAGTISAMGGTDNLGIYGVAPDATLQIYKVCNNAGFCSGDAISAAITRAADDGANIISMSLGGSLLSSAEKSALDYATGKDVLIIAAAGNDGPSIDTIGYPAGYNKVVAVAALENQSPLRVADFSSRGIATTSFDETVDRLVEVAAPGRAIESTWNNNAYNTISGTSMATPHISGLAAKIWNSIIDANNDGKVSDDVRHWLQTSAQNYDITSGISAGAHYDPAAGIGMPTVP